MLTQARRSGGKGKKEIKGLLVKTAEEAQRKGSQGDYAHLKFQPKERRKLGTGGPHVHVRKNRRGEGKKGGSHERRRGEEMEFVLEKRGGIGVPRTRQGS